MVRNHLNKLAIPFRQKAHVKSRENCSSSFREDIKTLKILYMYVAQWQGQITLRGQNYVYNKNGLRL